MIQSHELPERMVEIGGIRKYRINVKEVVGEDNIMYTYEEIEFSTDVPVEICESKVARHESKLKSKEAIEYLESTDWVVAKISEASVLGENIDELKTKYKDVLDARAVARTKA